MHLHIMRDMIIFDINIVSSDFLEECWSWYIYTCITFCQNSVNMHRFFNTSEYLKHIYIYMRKENDTIIRIENEREKERETERIYYFWIYRSMIERLYFYWIVFDVFTVCHVQKLKGMYNTYTLKKNLRYNSRKLTLFKHD